MTKYLPLFLLFICSLSACARNDKEGSPLYITKKLFGKDGFPDKKKYLCCEMDSDIKSDSTIGQRMGREYTREYAVLSAKATTAVTTVSIIKGKEQQDWYIYFKKETNWKVEAIRALAMTGFTQKMVEHLESLPPDSLQILVLKNKYDLKGMQLTIASDKTLMQFFKDNRKAFDSIASLYYQRGYQDEESNELSNKDKDLTRLRRSVHASGIGPDERLSVSLCVNIGGMLDNTVGYFYQPDKSKVPEMSKSYFIMIREISDGWYLYKTT